MCKTLDSLFSLSVTWIIGKIHRLYMYTAIIFLISTPLPVNVNITHILHNNILPIWMELRWYTDYKHYFSSPFFVIYIVLPLYAPFPVSPNRQRNETIGWFGVRPLSHPIIRVARLKIESKRRLWRRFVAWPTRAGCPTDWNCRSHDCNEL